MQHSEVMIGEGGIGQAGEGPALAGEFRAVWHGDPWHGPALKQLLEGVSAERAAARPPQGGHSLWELVLHMAAWTDVGWRRLEGLKLDEPEAGDFPPVSATTPRAWAEALAWLESAYGSFAERVARLTPAELDATVPGCEYDARFLVKGVIRHTVYHSGQVAVLKKSVARLDPSPAPA